MAHVLAEAEFPPFGHLVEWKDIAFGGTWYAVNKVVLISFAAVFLTLLVFFLGSRKKAMVPRGAQNFVESIVDFIETGIIEPTMGRAGLPWAWFLTALFMFITFSNLFEIAPGIQMPATARMATPLFLALLAWVCYVVVGFKVQGFSYLKNSLFPPGVPWPLYFLITPIEFISVFFVRPISLAIRLFANLLAGHILLVTFAFLTTALLESTIVALKPVAVLPFLLLIMLTGFEIFVSLLQAYIFTLLTALYIGSSQHPEH